MGFTEKRKNHKIVSWRKGHARVEFCEEGQCFKEAALIHMEGRIKGRDRVGRCKVKLSFITLWVFLSDRLG